MTTYAEEQIKLYYDTWALRRQGDLAKYYYDPGLVRRNTLEGWITYFIDCEMSLDVNGVQGLWSLRRSFTDGISLGTIFLSDYGGVSNVYKKRNFPQNK